MNPRVSCLLLGSLLGGCVGVANTGNWQPQSSSLDKDYYQCEREAQQGYSSASATVNPSGGSGFARSGAKTNYGLLSSCMKAQGYSKRAATTTETVLALVFSPIWLPFVVLAWMGGADFDWQH